MTYDELETALAEVRAARGVLPPSAEALLKTRCDTIEVAWSLSDPSHIRDDVRGLVKIAAANGDHELRAAVGRLEALVSA